MSSGNQKVFMEWTVEDIRNYMKEKNIDNNLDTNKTIGILGISRIEKIDEYYWILYMEVQKIVFIKMDILS